MPRVILNRRSARMQTVRAWVLAALTIGGCAGAGQRIDELASRAGFRLQYVYGTQFRHLAATTPDADSDGPVWAYIEGDGLPWIDGTIPAPDPTPRTLVALEMMQSGPRPALYLGRPCYHGAVKDTECEPVWWTHRRFSA